MNSKFQLTTVLSLIGFFIVGLLSVVYSSFFLLIVGWILIVCIHQGLFVYGMFVVGSDFFYKSVKGKEFFGDQNGILFRFDDGPHPVYTPQILDILKLEGIQGLFAVTGKYAEEYPEIVKRIYSEHHIIANHTYSHPLNVLLLSYHKIKDEIVKTNAIIQNITGQQPRYFCSPMGHANPIIGRVIKELNLIPLTWDIRTFDTRSSLDEIMKTIKRKLKSPAIIVFHDAIIWSKTGRESTVLALKETIGILKEKGYL